jgi:ubiquinone/menaquinone biosynthesis C-methylase UbiE
MDGTAVQSNPESKPVTPERIMQLAWAYAPPLIIGAAITNKVFDELDKCPATADELARRTKASLRGLTSLLDALVALQLATRDPQKNRYGLTPESAAFLVTTKPSFQGGIFKHIAAHLIPAWLELGEIVRTGKPARQVNSTEGAEFFESFVEDIFPMSYGATKVLAGNLKLDAATKTTRVLDIASGSGVWGIGLAQANKHVEVTAVDWERVLGVTRRVAAKHGVGGQFKYIAGDICKVDFGRGYDIATLGHILHSEGPEHSQLLIKRVFDALAPGGTIAIAEFVANDDRTGPMNAMIFAVNMLVNTDEGNAFTFAQISGWLRDAGFENVRQLEAPAPSPLILANKPK